MTQRSKGQGSRSHGYENRHGRTVASDTCCAAVAAAAGVGLHVDSTAYDFWLEHGIALTGRNRTGPPCSVGRPTARQTTDADRPASTTMLAH